MFNKFKTDSFYHRLSKNKYIPSDYFYTINEDLKKMIIQDPRFVENIDVRFLLKEVISENDNFFVLDDAFLEVLSEEDIKKLFDRISASYFAERINLTDLFPYLKDKYLETLDDNFKESIAELLFATVKESVFPKTEYINNFMNILDSEEKKKILENDNLFKFLTFHSKSINKWYGYNNFFDNFLVNVEASKDKDELMTQIFELMSKDSNIKSLYLTCALNNLETEDLIKKLRNEEYQEFYKYQGDNRDFNYETLLDIVNGISDEILKKELILNYFKGFEYVGNIIRSRNTYNSQGETIDGKTISAFYELNMINSDIDELIVKYCKDEFLFDYLNKFQNKKERLLEVSQDVDMNLLIGFAKENNIDIYEKEFADKFYNSDIYFESLSAENAHLIKCYFGHNNELFFSKVALCSNQTQIILSSIFHMDKKMLLDFANSHNINIFTSTFAQRYSEDDDYYELLSNDNSNLIKYYGGKNLELFFNKLSFCNNKLDILFNSVISNNKLLQEALTNEMFNDFDKKIIMETIKIKDKNLKGVFKDYVLKNYEVIPEEKIEFISQTLLRLDTTNALEMAAFKTEIANQLLELDDPLKKLNQIENVFLKNHLPTIGKVFATFEILHPNFKGFDFSENSKVSPVLKEKSLMSKKITVFNDLLLASLGSNNRSLKEYINNLEMGNNLYKLIMKDKLDYKELDKERMDVLSSYLKNLITLYNNSKKGKEEPLSLSGNMEMDIKTLSEIFNGYDNLSDHIVRMFCHFAGFDTLEELKKYMQDKMDTKNIRNQRILEGPITLESGDFIKGIGDIMYLKNILQNGSVSKEFLGESATSDMTPLDTDLSMIAIPGSNIEQSINSTISKGYGPIWIVMKNDDRFVVTRTGGTENTGKVEDRKYEVFQTLESSHYGIRTGFASSDIDYIISKDSDLRIGLELAMNGFYIPVINMDGELIFSKEDFEKLRSKMSGMNYYGISDYNFSNNLENKQTIEIVSQIKNHRLESFKEKDVIYHTIENCLSTLNLSLKDYHDGDLSEGVVELIDTGSTGRETNLIGDGDYDLMMRLDRNILLTPEKLEEVKTSIIKSFESIDDSTKTHDGNFRFKGVKLIGLDKKIDLDITFTQKTNKINYSTDSAIKDRLESIKKCDSEKYDLVLANILLAKETLKSAEVYKPDRGNTPQGGLGGVGVENWILQNGGSFIDAANSFLEASKDKSFEEFIKSYQVWDFGENYMSFERRQYAHDNFVLNNMSETGYYKMQEVLQKYLTQTYEKDFNVL